MAYLPNKRILISKLEGTAGTPETPAAADYDCNVYEPKYEPMVAFDGGLKVATIDHGESLDYAGTQFGKVSFKLRLSAPTAVNVMPKWGKYLKGCGIIGAAEGTTLGYSLTPLAAGDKVTMTHSIVDVARGGSPVGITHTIAGSMGNGKISAAGVGKPIEAALEFTGKHVAAADLANGALTTLAVQTAVDAGSVYTFQGFTVTYNSIVFQISSFELDFGNKIEPEYDPGDTHGGQVAYFGIVDRAPRYKFNPLKVAVSSYDAYTKMTANTAAKLTMAAATAIPIKLTLSNGQITAAKEQAREGLYAWETELKCLRNGIDGAKIVSDMATEAAWELLFGAKS